MNSNKFFYFIETLLMKFEWLVACLEIDIEIRIESLKLEFEKFDNQFNKQIRKIQRILLKSGTKINNLSFKLKRFYLSSDYIGRLHMEN